MSLGRLVAQFGEFLSRQSATFFDATPSEVVFPSRLARLREQFGHHILLLSLLSRSDGEAATLERQLIWQHCLDEARKAGAPATAAEAAELGDYVRELRPTMTEFYPAIGRLENGSKEEVVALVATAKAIVDADGTRRPREVEFLADLTRELEAL
jgi:hypothetical protein